MTEQLGFAARPAADGALKLSSAVVTPAGDDALLPWELSISALVLGETEIMLATTHRPGGSTAHDHHELHVNAVLLSMIPDVLHLAGRGEFAARRFPLAPHRALRPKRRKQTPGEVK
ncbi:hypothetical protein [Amycolatopsis kentuckyensis]|uniref:hypothetical protein n=1 Tax=Amycolatopsis kentuckyensis TaxID=218823 RepID=UPI003566DAF9